MEWPGVDVNYPSACELYLDGRYISYDNRQSHNTQLITFTRGWVSESSVARFLFNKLVVTGEKALLLTDLELITDATR